MDANNIAVQVVSHSPMSAEVNYMVAETRHANDQLAERIDAAAKDPHGKRRFRGFCVLPMAFPAESAGELRRCVTELGFVGALVDAHVVRPDQSAWNGSMPSFPITGGNVFFYDSPAYDVLWTALVELDVPIYLHSIFPPLDDMIANSAGLYAGSATSPPSFSDGFGVRLGTAAWGWHSHVGLGFLKLYVGGVFDRFPRLQVVLGHMGEMVPFYLWRTNRVLGVGRPAGSATLREVYDRNVHVTMAGIWSLEPLMTVLNMTSKKRVLYSVDYPFASNAEGKAFMEVLRTSGLVGKEDYKDIAYRNAKRLLKI